VKEDNHIVALWRSGSAEVKGSPFAKDVRDELYFLGRHGVRLILATAFSSVGLQPPAIGTVGKQEFPDANVLVDSAFDNNTNLVYIKAPVRRVGNIQVGLKGGYEALLRDADRITQRDPQYYAHHGSWIGQHVGGLYIMPPSGIVLADAQEKLTLPLTVDRNTQI